MKRLLIVLAILLTASPALAGMWAGGGWATNWNGGDARYLNESDNLSDVDSAPTAFGNIKQAATTSATGVMEWADATEKSDATAYSRALSPGAAYSSPLGTKWVVFDAVPPETVNSTHEKDECYVVWPESGTWNLVAIEAHSLTAATAGTLTVNLYNATDSQNMLSTALTIDVNETDSSTAATPRVIDTAHDDVTAGDVLFPVISVAGDGYGCQIRAGFQKQ